MDCWHQWGITVVFIAFISALLISGVFAGKADARAYFEELYNRNTKLDLPFTHDYNNSSWRQVLVWPGTGGKGNLGIGNGSVFTLINDTTTSEDLLPENYGAGAVSVDADPYAMGVYHPPDRSFPEIFNEYPDQCATIYGKLVGLHTAGGHVVNMAIRSLGVQYASKSCPEGGCPICDLSKTRS